MYVYMYMYMYVCICVYIYICTHMYTYSIYMHMAHFHCFIRPPPHHSGSWPCQPAQPSQASQASQVAGKLGSAAFPQPAHQTGNSAMGRPRYACASPASQQSWSLPFRQTPGVCRSPPPGDAPTVAVVPPVRGRAAGPRDNLTLVSMNKTFL